MCMGILLSYVRYWSKPGVDRLGFTCLILLFSLKIGDWQHLILVFYGLSRAYGCSAHSHQILCVQPNNMQTENTIHDYQ